MESFKFKSVKNISTGKMNNEQLKFDQIIVYGPKGWIGKTALEFLNNFPEVKENPNRVILVGKKKEEWSFNDKTYSIIEGSDALSSIKKNSLFINCAFLRREKLASLELNSYYSQNLEMMNFTKKMIKTGKIKSFINLSSGAASIKEIESILDGNDIYADLKYIDECWLADTAQSTSTSLINCRVFSLTGKYINDFENLALGRFFHDAIKLKLIKVNSSQTTRTFLSARNLIEVLFALAQKGESINLDSGGTLTTMSELAFQISELFPGCAVEEENNNPNNYWGDYKRFSNTAERVGVHLLDITEQITEMLPFNIR
jgi:nucleoside-diphosphate-sugar epimerase